MSHNPGLSAWDARWIDVLLVVMVMFAVLPSGFSWREVDDAAVIAEGSVEFKLQWGSLFALSIYVAYRHMALAVDYLRSVNPFLLLMLAVAFAGVAWSPVPETTLKKVVQFAGLIVFSLAVHTDGKPWVHWIKMLQLALVAIMLASVVAAIGFPSLGIDSYFGYAWRGVLSGKNTLGGTAALSVILWPALWRHGGLSRAKLWSGLGLSVLCVVMSTSSTAVTIMALGLVVYGLLGWQHVRSTLWLLRLIVVMGMVLLLSAFLFYVAEARFPERTEVLEPFANLFGKSADLTGRSDIWAPLAIETEKHWLLGIGYGAFWLGPGSASQPILDSLPWIPYQAHNGYLDLLNELGAVGATLFAGLLLWHVHELFQMLRFDRTGAAVFAAIQATLLASNMTESALFRGVTFQFCLFTLVCVSTSAALRRHQSQHLLTEPRVTPTRRPATALGSGRGS